MSSPTDVDRTLTWPGPPRLLTDWEIAAACREHLLVTVNGRGEHAEMRQRIRYCSYELSVSNRVQQLITSGDHTIFQDLLVEDDGFWVAGGATIRVFSNEVLRLPNFVFAQCIGIGQLFASGIVLGSTYVDPGSRGSIYVAMSNVGIRDVRIETGQPLARAFFTVLGTEVETPHPGPGGRRKIRYKLGGVKPIVPGNTEAIQSRLTVLEENVSSLPSGPTKNQAASYLTATVSALAATMSGMLFGGVAFFAHLGGAGWPVWLLSPSAAILTALQVSAGLWTRLSGQALSQRMLRIKVFIGAAVLSLITGLIVSYLWEELS